MNKRIERLIEACGNIVFFGGAGVSTESGVPDFRGQNGLYNQKYRYPPETMLSRSFFMSNTSDFYDFYRDKMIYPEARPNRAHIALARLERLGKLRAVITQNVDGLHQMAGSERVLELHGSVHRNHCARCGRFFDVRAITESAGVPACGCGGVIKPDVVLYEEALDEALLRESAALIADADMLIVGGTSLGVYPAAGLIRHYRGGKLVLINRTPTPMDGAADYIFRENIGDALGE